MPHCVSLELVFTSELIFINLEQKMLKQKTVKILPTCNMFN